MDICRVHDFELEYIAQKIKELNAKIVLIQLPNGFQRCYSLVEQRLKEYITRDLTIILSLNPSYGPCLVDEITAKDVNADIVIHFGHTEYPLYKPSTRVIYVPVEYIDMDIIRIESLLNSICENNKKICVASTSQHIKLCKNICISGVCNYIYKGVIYGCIPANADNCDMLVVVAGGKFSCISQYLALSSRYKDLAIYCLDPYSYTLWKPDNEAFKLMKTRMWKLSEAIGKKKWLIITGFYGQKREEIINKLVDRLRSRGLYVSIARVLKLDRDTIINLGKDFDVIVIGSCPYLAFDLYDIEQPILTIGEAFMTLDDISNRYVYPW